MSQDEMQQDALEKANREIARLRKAIETLAGECDRLADSLGKPETTKRICAVFAQTVADDLRAALTPPTATQGEQSCGVKEPGNVESKSAKASGNTAGTATDFTCESTQNAECQRQESSQASDQTSTAGRCNSQPRQPHQRQGQQTMIEELSVTTNKKIGKCAKCGGKLLNGHKCPPRNKIEFDGTNGLVEHLPKKILAKSIEKDLSEIVDRFDGWLDGMDGRNFDYGSSIMKKLQNLLEKVRT